MLDVGPEPAGMERDRLPIGGMRTDLAQGTRRRRGPAALRRLGQECQRAVHADREHVVIGLEPDVLALELDERPVPVDPGRHRLSGLGIGADLARQGQELQAEIEIDLGGCRGRRQRAALGLAARAALHVGAEAADLEPDLLAGPRVGPQHPVARALLVGRGIGSHREGSRVAAVGVARAANEGAEAAELEPQPALLAARAEPRVGLAALAAEQQRSQGMVERVDDLALALLADLGQAGGERLPELAQHVLPECAAAGHVVELVLELGGEVVLDPMAELLDQERVDQPALVLRHEPLLLQPYIGAVLEHGEDAGVGAGPADAQLLQLLDQARLGKARRRLGEVLERGHLALCHDIADRERREHRTLLVLLAGRVVTALLVELEEAVEGHGLPGRPQRDRPIGRSDVDHDAIEQGRRHLARHGALPDQLVEATLVVVEMVAQIARCAEQVGRADRLVRLLGVLGLGAVLARLLGNVGGAEALADQRAAGTQRLARELHAVGAHVGDQAHRLAAEVDALEQALRGLHRAVGREPQLARGLLLQGRGAEGRRRVAADLLLLDRVDHEVARGDRLHRAPCRRLVAQRELVEPSAVELGEPGLEGSPLRVLEQGLHGPVFLGVEGQDLGLALADQPQGHRLHPAGRGAGLGQLAPEHGREAKAHEIVEGAACLVGVDQVLVEWAPMAHGVEDGGLGDLVEHDPLDLHARERLLLA